MFVALVLGLESSLASNCCHIAHFALNLLTCWFWSCLEVLRLLMFLDLLEDRLFKVLDYIKFTFNSLTLSHSQHSHLNLTIFSSTPLDPYHDLASFASHPHTCRTHCTVAHLYLVLTCSRIYARCGQRALVCVDFDFSPTQNAIRRAFSLVLGANE